MNLSADAASSRSVFSDTAGSLYNVGFGASLSAGQSSLEQNVAHACLPGTRLKDVLQPHSCVGI